MSKTSIPSPTPNAAAPWPETVRNIAELVTRHSKWRTQTLNLIASENTISPSVRQALENEWYGRYADFTARDLDARRYRGTRYIRDIEKTVEALAKELFGARYVEFRPIAGHLAGAAVLMAFCRPGDTVLELGRSSGGHREATKLALPPLMQLDVRFLPFDGTHYNVDVAATTRLIAETEPRVVILGSSNFLFPHPVREIKEALQAGAPDGILVYDASHVLGLVAGGMFQDPLDEGADLVFSSTHKTFPGPQGGIIFTNHQELITKVSEAVYPGLVTNHHPFRMPALAVALAEMLTFGKQYATRIQTNAQALGMALEAEGIPCVNVDGIYSRSHTVLARVAAFGDAGAIATRLEAADIICTATGLPDAQGGSGIRLGVQELSHHGALPETMATVARLIADSIQERRAPEAIAADVHAFTDELGPVQFTW